MPGLDEARARSVLADMQDRLVRDPSAALGLPARATAEDVRGAFLALTKQFHPVRFGRMAPDIQKLANEVFLSLRAAHDTLARSLGRQTGPISRPRTLTPLGVPSAAAPQAGAIQGPGRSVPAVPSRSTRPLPLGGSHETGARAAGPTGPAGPAGAMPSAMGSGAMRPMQPPMPPPDGQKTAPLSPLAARGAPTAAPPPGPLRPPAPPIVARPMAPSRQAAPTGSTGATGASAMSEAAVVELLQRGAWEQARGMLRQLSAQDPGSRRLGALLCYARGREAQHDQRLDDARVELQDALDLDPTLEVAKLALTELFTASRMSRRPK